MVEANGIPSVAVECVDIRRNTSGEGGFLDCNWRWGTKVWGANRIRYPGSPHRKRWILGVGDDFIICAESKRNKYPTWGVRPQGWNSKELTGARTSSGACGLIRRNAKNLTKTWHRMTAIEIWNLFGAYRQVVHGCRQLVSWDVRLSPITSATLILSC